MTTTTTTTTTTAFDDAAMGRLIAEAPKTWWLVDQHRGQVLNGSLFDFADGRCEYWIFQQDFFVVGAWGGIGDDADRFATLADAEASIQANRWWDVYLACLDAQAKGQMEIDAASDEKLRSLARVGGAGAEAFAAHYGLDVDFSTDGTPTAVRLFQVRSKPYGSYAGRTNLGLGYETLESEFDSVDEARDYIEQRLWSELSDETRCWIFGDEASARAALAEWQAEQPEG